MLNVLLSNKALDDLKDIGRYTEERWGREQRNKYLSILDGFVQSIACDSAIGSLCDYIRPGYRKYYVGRHFIYYRQSTSELHIIRILHERMDVKNHLPLD